VTFRSFYARLRILIAPLHDIPSIVHPSHTNIRNLNRWSLHYFLRCGKCCLGMSSATVTYLISNKDYGRSMEVAQMAESGPRIAIFCCNWCLLHRCRSHRCQQATALEKPAGSSREDMTRLGLDGRAKTAQNSPVLSACQFILDDTVCTIGSVIPYADSLGFSSSCVDPDSSSDLALQSFGQKPDARGPGCDRGTMDRADIRTYPWMFNP
jgi:Fe-S-cluster containining protein